MKNERIKEKRVIESKNANYAKQMEDRRQRSFSRESISIITRDRKKNHMSIKEMNVCAHAHSLTHNNIHLNINILGSLFCFACAHPHSLSLYQ